MSAQMLNRLRETACNKASLIARASPIHGDDTKDWATDPRASSLDEWSEKFQAKPAALSPFFQEALVLRNVSGEGRV